MKISETTRHTTLHIKKAIGGLILVLALAEVLLVFTSWLLSAMMVEGVRSMLSSEGIRWFFGSFSTMMSTPWLFSLLLLAMAGGCLWRSRLLTRPRSYRERASLRTILILLVLYIAIVAALAVAPHAILLSATGRLLPSPFSRAFFPILSFGVLIISAVYGMLTGRFNSLTAVLDALYYGIAQSAPLFVLYIVAAQFYYSLTFVF